MQVDRRLRLGAGGGGDGGVTRRGVGPRPVVVGAVGLGGPGWLGHGLRSRRSRGRRALELWRRRLPARLPPTTGRPWGAPGTVPS